MYYLHFIVTITVQCNGISYCWAGWLVVVQSLSPIWFLWPHRLQHASLSCFSLSLGVCSNSCPLSRWCHPTISSSIAPVSFCPQSFPASGSFQWVGSSQSVVQSTGSSASASVLSMNIQGWFSLGLTDLIPLLSKGLSRVFSSATIWKHQFFNLEENSSSGSAFYIVQLSHRTWLLEKP